MKIKNYCSMPEIFKQQVEKFKNMTCVLYKDPKENVYNTLSWSALFEMVQHTAYYLLSLGIKKGDRVAIYAANCYEWWVADQAILAIGAVTVPIYATDSSEEALYVLQHSEAKACFLGDAEHYERILAIKKKISKLKTFVIFRNIKSKQNIVTLEAACSVGAGFKKKSLLEKRTEAIKSDDLATIIYTSGTTGNRKGVMLTHGNLFANVKQIEGVFGNYVQGDDIFLSFLPLSHALERTAGYYFPVFKGAKVAFAESFSTVSQNLQEVKPTIMVSVPRLYEKIHAVILSRVGESSFLKRMLFQRAMTIAARYVPYFCTNRKRGWLFDIQYRFFEKRVYARLRHALGMDRIKIAISGGGALSVSDAEFFLGMGIRILEGYGLTETSPVTNANPPHKNKVGSVGPALPETEIRISNDGEVLIKGPQVMLGYYNDKKRTKEVFTKDGFFKTGDLGLFDQDAYLTITGRIKDIIVTAGGKNISPQNIENSLKNSIYIEQVAVIGDRRKFISALIVPDFEELKKWAKANKIQFSSHQDLVLHPKVRELIRNEIEENTVHFSRVEQVKNFVVLDKEWSQKSGELTPSLKVKRRVIEEKYHQEIESMYAEH